MVIINYGISINYSLLSLSILLFHNNRVITGDTVRCRFSAESRRYILYVYKALCIYIQMQFIPPDRHSNGVSFLLSICLELLCLHCSPRPVEPDHLFQSLHNLNTCREISTTRGIIEISLNHKVGKVYPFPIDDRNCY